MTQLKLTLDRPCGLCRLCGSSDGQQLIVREEKAGAGQWLMQCRHCRGLYLDPDMTPDGLAHFYATDYRRLYPFEYCSTLDEDFLHAIRCRQTGLRRARALAPMIRPHGRVLEIGSGHGGFLGRLHHLRPDLDFAAIEPDQEHRGLAVDGAAVTFVDWDDLAGIAPFDLIVLFHSLEHMLDPVASLQRLSSILAENGRMVIEVPRIRPDALAWGDIHPAHVTCFTAATLHRTCCRAGLVPRPALASRAALPDSLWMELTRDGVSDPCPTDSPLAMAPPRRRWWKRMLRDAVLNWLPPAWSGRLSRWRHAPSMDDALAEGTERVFRWGIPFDLLSMKDMLQRAEQSMTQRQSLRVADVNVAKLTGLLADADFRLSVLTADAVVVDGMGVLWGLRWLGLTVAERVSGVDLLDQVIGLCAQRGFRPYILGAKHDVLERAVATLRQRYPALQMAGYRDGYFPAADDDVIAAELAAVQADCLIVALPYPRQDLFMARIHAATGIPLAFGVGGSLDVLAGDRRRAPPWMQSCGLEWLFRLLQEPLRLGPRYVSSNGRFLVSLLWQWLARRLVGR